jgi:hypothetical protein
MKQIPSKTNFVDEVDASEFNSISFELQNIVDDSGQSLSEGDQFQVSKAAAVYAGAGDYYIDTGTAAAYQLDTPDSKKFPPTYYNGQRVRFQPVNSNTGAATARIDTLPVKNIKKNNGADDLEPNDIVAGFEAILSYRTASGGYWELVNEIEEATEDRRGIIQIATDAEVLAASNTDKAVVPGYMIDHPGVAKAWVTFNGTEGSPITPLEEHNILTIVRNDTGRFTVTLSITFNNLYYCPMVSHRGTADTDFQSIEPISASQAYIVMKQDGAFVNHTRISAIFFGTLAAP